MKIILEQEKFKNKGDLGHFQSTLLGILVLKLGGKLVPDTLNCLYLTSQGKLVLCLRQIQPNSLEF